MLTEKNICTDSGLNEQVQVQFDVIGSGDQEKWLIIDENGLIVSFNETPPFNFEGTGFGTVTICHITHDDTIGGLQQGQPVSGLTGCFSKSNALVVFKESCGCTPPDAGFVAVSSGAVCEGVPGIITLGKTNGGGSENHIWIINMATNVIEVVLPTELTYDFSQLDAGTYRVVIASYDTLEEDPLGMDINNVAGCLTITEAQTTVLVDDSCCLSEDGGAITSDDTIGCVGQESVINFSITQGDGAGNGFLIVDKDGVVQYFGGIGETSYDFSSLPVGAYAVYNVSYFSLTNPVNTHIDNLIGCSSLSSPIFITNQVCISGPAFCRGLIGVSCGDVIPAGYIERVSWEVTVVQMGDIPAYQFLTLSEMLNIVVNNAPAGHNASWRCEGAEIYIESDLSDLNGIQFSDNNDNVTFVTAYDCGNCVDPGSITTNDETTICADDGVPSIVTFNIIQGGGAENALIVTDLSNGGEIIALLPPGVDSYDFEGTGLGEYQIYAVSYDTISDTNGNIQGLTGCYALSDSFVTIQKTSCSSCPITPAVISASSIGEICRGSINDVNSIVFQQLSGCEGPSSRSLVVVDSSGVIVSIISSISNSSVLLLNDLSLGSYNAFLYCFSGAVSGLEEGLLFSNVAVGAPGCDAQSNIIDFSIVDCSNCLDFGRLTEFIIGSDPLPGDEKWIAEIWTPSGTIGAGQSFVYSTAEEFLTVINSLLPGFYYDIGGFAPLASLYYSGEQEWLVVLLQTTTGMNAGILPSTFYSINCES